MEKNVWSVSQHDQYGQRLIIPNMCFHLQWVEFKAILRGVSDKNDNANVEKSLRSKKVEWKQMKMKQVKKPLRHFHWAVFVILYFFWHASGRWFFIVSFFWFECLIKPFRSYTGIHSMSTAQKTTLSKIIIHSVLKTSTVITKMSKIIYLFSGLNESQTPKKNNIIQGKRV